MRKTVYMTSLVVFVLLVVLKARYISSKDVQEIVSIQNEWKRYGFPVDVARVVTGKAYCIRTLSGVTARGGIIKSDVPSSLAGELAVGMYFHAVTGGDKIDGNIVSISAYPDMLTGLYAVVMRPAVPIPAPEGTIIVARVRTKTYPDMVKIPQAAVVKQNGDPYCWVVSGEKPAASVRKVQTGIRCGPEIQIISGLMPGEDVCVAGMALLEEGCMVRIRRKRGGS